jgi:exoribonuclease R
VWCCVPCVADDAVHVTQVSENQFELVVHIADVSHFVRPGTALDREARRRAESVYLVHRTLPMLPRRLSEDVCSLLPLQVNRPWLAKLEKSHFSHLPIKYWMLQDRLAVSVICRVDGEGRLAARSVEGRLVPWVELRRSIIRSCCRLDYNLAQRVIDWCSQFPRNEPLGPVPEEVWPSALRPPARAGVTAEQLAGDLRVLHRLAMSRRRIRVERGVIESRDLELEFELDREQGGLPSAVEAVANLPANDMIEEVMLLINNLASRRLLEDPATRDSTLLRRQPTPSESSRAWLGARLRGLGYPAVEMGDPVALTRFLAQLTGIEADPVRAAGVRKLVAFCNRPSESRVARGLLASEWGHHGVGMTHYTWYSSPIRRYHDLVVHRLLLGEGDPASASGVDLEMLAADLTCKSRLIGRAQARCELIYLVAYLSGAGQKQTRQRGFVLRVSKAEMRVYLPAWDLDCGVEVSQPHRHEMGDVVEVEVFGEGSPVELRGRVLPSPRGKG